jgi:uncharacterized protein YggE
MADVVFSVTARDKDFKAAKAAHDEAIGQVKQYLLESEHKDDHFELKSTRLYRDRRDGYELEDDYYLCSSAFFVRTSRLDDLAGFQAALVERGVDEINGVTLFSSTQREQEDAARRLAISDARKKVELTAEELGWRLGKIVRIEYGETRYHYGWRQGGGGGYGGTDGRGGYGGNGGGGGYGTRGGREGGASPENLAGEDYVESNASLTFSYSIK